MKLCTVDGCDRQRRSHGMCSTHLYRRSRGLALDEPVRQYEQGDARVCKLIGCDKERGMSGEFCNMHHRRRERRGDPGAAERERAPSGEAVWNEPTVSRVKKLRVEYGMTIEDYERLLNAQGGGCAICRSRSAKSTRARSRYSFVVDHDHVTGHVRGLLCQPCNRFIGLAGDDPDVLDRAAAYVRSGRQLPLFGPAGKVLKPA